MEEITSIPKRVVSLVPSLTESLFVLGYGSSVVGITEDCVYPPEKLAGLARVGGTRTARVADILALNPDLVVANQDENDRETVRAMQSAGVPVWLTFPKTVHDVIMMLWDMCRLFKTEDSNLRLIMLEKAYDWLVVASHDNPGFRYFCPLRQGEGEKGESWWMTFNAETYPASLLSLFGGENIFPEGGRGHALAEEEYSGEADMRYACVTTAEVLAAQPGLIILAGGLFDVSQESVDALEQELAGTPAVKNGRILVMDGTLLTWAGTRLALALDCLPGLLQIG
jgi:ABC-type hemin transport system substrate-binding protein